MSEPVKRLRTKFFRKRLEPREEAATLVEDEIRTTTSFFETVVWSLEIPGRRKAERSSMLEGAAAMKPSG